ncbi:rhodanese-like domain-containing protein [Streptococcus cuniculi]|uniref:Rhodanese-like domain-containing protein n=1 Tax=Streptococcus cuniculi TaxID=1432788 RepID=A0A4Y9JEK3_9STRE|nr:rhodanese-like domain-containing protein [Streptococcus cuniculi]MBF0777402.1 rhodanese-like domain-containing protein [Streptococcus cuniculi]TFU99001.1 rhodanese-like domain-containing protein [Streptococcus cuniculi]
MKKSRMILLVLVLVAGFVGFQQMKPSSQPEEKRMPRRPLVGVEPNIKWSEASQDAQTYQIRFDQVEAAVKSGAKCYDVRSFIEYQLGHVEIAEHYPLTTLGKQEFPTLVHDVPIYLYGSDSVSSAQAAQLLRDEGFQYVYDLGSVDQIKAIGATIQEWWSFGG